MKSENKSKNKDKTMQKVLIDCRYWGPTHTGLGRYTQSLVTAIYKLKPKLDVSLIVQPKAKKTLQKNFKNFTLVTSNSRPYSVSEQMEIPKLIKSINPDLVHFLHFNVPLLVNSPFIVTIHDLIKHHSSGISTTTRSIPVYMIKRLGYKATINHAVNKSKKILTPSAWVKKDILKFYSPNPSKITITPEAADQNYLTTKFSKTSPLKSNYLLYVGNAYPHKNLNQLIKAVQIINRSVKLKLVVVTGRDIFYQRLRDDIRNLKAQKIIKIKGFSSDSELKNLYHHAHAFITPSLLEGFGLPGLEAMASKTLVLSSNRSSLKEVYKNHPIYFNPESLNDMVKKIKLSLNLTPKQRSKKTSSGYSHAKSFSWGKTALKTIKAYEDCLNLR